MLKAVNASAWEKTGAVRWSFAGRNQHLWDRRRGFSRVEWGDVRALIDLDHRIGRAFEMKGGGGGCPPDKRYCEEVRGEEAAKLLDSAHARWTNDSFWLNPIAKVFDPGVERELVRAEQERGLLVRFASGGRTPGDVYVFWLRRDVPYRWQMWVSILPIGGVSASWEGWIRLKTGARVSTKHSTGLMDLELTDVRGGYTLQGVEPGRDPFAELVACRDQPLLCASF